MHGALRRDQGLTAQRRDVSDTALAGFDLETAQFLNRELAFFSERFTDDQRSRFEKAGGFLLGDAETRGHGFGKIL